MKKVTVRKAMASTLVTALVLTGVGVNSNVADASTKTTQVAKKKFDYKKYRAKQTKVVASYGSTLFHMGNLGGIKVPDYITDSVYRAKVEAYNKKSKQYMTDRKKARKEAEALKKLIKEVNTQKERKAADKRIDTLKKETIRLTKAEKVLTKEGQALYKVIVDYENKQIKLFEGQYGSITKALTVLDYKDYANRLKIYLDANNFSADEKIEIMDQVYDRLLYAREDSSEIVGDKRGAIRLLVYAGKFEEANQLFVNTKETILVEENAKLDALYTKIIEVYMTEK
ncbi:MULTISPECIES: hypothetical protein [Exiguobacterium]|uniref:SbsC C-terminal domain-containing protein n=1 Tax=Exiguobacterium sibiricum (strain DSM 17290 / CCUG 55495 / CIP 109462 / JCM 13490 / 255-15) TaxID=262543 RepID=B1YFA9_EXIS2|nr:MULTISPECIES: hypothetical protein [Exiguobacterium]ACB60785.1 hypothetical protein Exig_1312 [Exiguobacterium sibiricum 255-15]MDX1259157.1 hypothetical protein [Exiguobacterium sp. K1]